MTDSSARWRFQSRDDATFRPRQRIRRDDIEIQRDQFLRVNNTRPLPRGLITELLPEVSTPLPANLEAKKIPSAICELLNSNEHSPFYNDPARLTFERQQEERDYIRHVDHCDSSGSISHLLDVFFRIGTSQLVRQTSMVSGRSSWRTGPRLKPRFRRRGGNRLARVAYARCRASLNGKADGSRNVILDPRSPHVLGHVKHELQVIAPVCRWTSGRWAELGDLQWNEIQNVPRHIRMLSSFLIRAYVQNRSAIR